MYGSHGLSSRRLTAPAALNEGLHETVGEAVVRTARKVLPLAQEASDEGSVNLITDRMGVHEKTAWMLRSMI